MRRRRNRIPLNAEINVVSLIDVMMLLLVIFMITAPMMQGGIDVTLPKAEARSLDPKSGLVVTIDQNNRIFVDRTSMSIREFQASFKSLAGDRRAKQGVYLQADRTVRYEVFAQVLGIMQKAGVTAIGLTVDQISK
jgi:biopolymer transport protein ExbD/biopolymer transport protein TolR